ncbi:MAG: hypothetical protein ACKOLA_08730 [Spartobacteria bacterium]
MKDRQPRMKRIPANKSSPGSADVPVGPAYIVPKFSRRAAKAQRKEGGSAVSAVKETRPRIHANQRE